MPATDGATPSQALLALYGALDQAVTETGDAEIEAIVERYLPGTTGPNAGWYGELLGFLSGFAPRVPEPFAVPDLSQALTVLQGRKKRRTRAGREPQPAVQYTRGTGLEPQLLTTVQLSRMVYGIGALSHLPGKYPTQQYDAQFAQTLATAGGGPGDQLLDLLRRDFDGPDDFLPLMAIAQQRGLISSDVAAVPLCQRKFKWVRGHLCVVLTTDFPKPNVSLDDLKGVIDPLNWAKCLPFFCEMTPEQPRPDGWSRVLEHVSIDCSGPQMVTPLKYWKVGQPADLSACVDYALDDQPAQGEKGDGRMLVDEGFIRMTSTATTSAQQGVRVRTRKVAGFRNLGWAAAGMFACLMGYGSEGEDMLLDGVAKRAADNGVGWMDWAPSPAPSASGSGPAPAEPGQPGQPADGGDATKRAVALAVGMVNECIDDMSKQSAALAAKWATGVAPIAETMAYTADLAARLATDPWRYLERLRDPAKGGDK
ncbi:MAG TPA: hypothetical protein VFQ37_07720 [Mycobacterium sp.]|nr:hypothetical protein [Mycobacterium sp.]